LKACQSILGSKNAGKCCSILLSKNAGSSGQNAGGDIGAEEKLRRWRFFFGVAGVFFFEVRVATWAQKRSFAGG
jgi:hypothetical protein